jgi:hypothetical protein
MHGQNHIKSAILYSHSGLSIGFKPRYLWGKNWILVKSKFHPTTVHEDPKGGEVYLCCFFNLGCTCGGWSRPPSGRFPTGQTWYPLYMELDGLQGRSGWTQENSHPPGFDSLTFRPVVAGYTNYAIPAHPNFLYIYIHLCIVCTICLLYHKIVKLTLYFSTSTEVHNSKFKK